MKKYLTVFASVALVLGLVYAGIWVAGRGLTSSAEQAQQEQTQPVMVDIDLTQMSSSMVNAQVFNLTNSPKDYVGKVIKIQGLYSSMFFDQTQQTFHFVLISDAAACCQQGIEFAWEGEHVYPDDYPEESALIELTGVYESYDEDGVIYYHIVTNEIKVV